MKTVRQPITEADIMLAAIRRSTRREDWLGVMTCMIGQHQKGVLNQLVRDTFLKRNPHNDLDDEARKALGLRLKIRLNTPAKAKCSRNELEGKRNARRLNDRARTNATRGDAPKTKAA